MLDTLPTPRPTRTQLAIADATGPADSEAAFQHRTESFARLATDMWLAAPSSAADLGRRYSPWSRWRRGRGVAAGVAELDAVLARHRSDDGGEVDEAGLRRELPRLGRAMLDRLDLDGVDAELLTRPDLTRATEEFVRAARDDDPELSAEELGQALRNFWVLNLFQLLQTGTARCTEASLGYSLLYPYTDNALDDPAVSAADKRTRSERLGLRLAGATLPPADAAEALVFAQLDRIDRELPRHRRPGLHLALQVIHGAQTASLRQQRGKVLDEHDLLRISVRKGGASVLVDAYLLDHPPSPELARFAFVYGVVLQLADDLQDVESDRAAGHQTLFTRAAERGTLDRAFHRLVHFLDATLDLCPEDAVANSADPLELRTLSRSCLVQLMIQAVAVQPECFSRRLRRAVARHSPLTFRRARRLRCWLAGSLGVSP